MLWFNDSWCLLKIFCAWPFLLVACAEEPQCPLPPSRIGLDLTDASASLDKFLEGSRAAYQCSKGYVKVGGSGEIFCSSKNSTYFEWTTETLKCRKKSCGSPGELLNGKFSTPGGIEFGATAYASCNSGFNMIGTGYRQCYDFGWNNRVPDCVIVKCRVPPPIDNGRMSNQPSKEFLEFGDIIMYACDRNYNLVGDSQLVCNEFGTYNGMTPLCKAPPPAPPAPPPAPTATGADLTREPVALEPKSDPEPRRNWFWTFFAIVLIIALCIVFMASCFIFRPGHRKKKKYFLTRPRHPGSQGFTGQHGKVSSL